MTETSNKMTILETLSVSISVLVEKKNIPCSTDVLCIPYFSGFDAKLQSHWLHILKIASCLRWS